TGPTGTRPDLRPLTDSQTALVIIFFSSLIVPNFLAISGIARGRKSGDFGDALVPKRNGSV
ncbi:MAG: hypothetical protein ACPGJE_00350, partial [Wenzhouxiangellaceae bacterium]